MSHDSTDLQESFFTITQDDFPAHIYMRGKLSRPPRLEILDQWMSSVVDPVFDPPPHRSRRDRCYLEPNETPSVIPTASICTGMDRWSQVWLGAMLLSPNTSTTTVAIKIYQQCLFPGETSQDGAKLSKVEAFSYVKMKNLQGREVPWSYGFYNVHRSFKFLCYLSDKTGQFKLPHGEVAIGHVMEYIPAPTCALLLEQISSAEGVVFLDFAFAGGADAKSIKLDAECLINILTKYDVQMRDIEVWYNNNSSEEWPRIFSEVKFSPGRKVGYYPGLVNIRDNTPKMTFQFGNRRDSE